jgi:ADP-ribosyl-[dinitrogen reductase] hydrolase
LLAGYFRWMKENGRGIGGLTRQVLALSDEGRTDAAERVWDERGGREGMVLGNGSVMRCVPIGVRWRDKPDKVIEQARIDSVLTHWDERCRWAEAATSLILAGFLVESVDPVGDTIKHLQKLNAEPEVLEALTTDAVGPGFPETGRIDGRGAGSCLLALRLARWAAEHGLDFRKSLSIVLQAGGDTDTNGAVVGAILGARFPDEIPEEWLECIPVRPEIEKLAEGLCGMADAGR